MAPTILHAPSGFLPPLLRLTQHDAATIARALQFLQDLYWPSHDIDMMPFTFPVPLTRKPRLLRQTTQDLIPDSGYASAEEDEDESCQVPEDGNFIDLDALRADTFERAFAIKWVTGFMARSELWLCHDVANEGEAAARVQLVDAASHILSAFTGVKEQEEPDLLRAFSFPLLKGTATVEVELNDAALLSQDHTSVGLQSWASSILLAEKLCASPEQYGLHPTASLRVLELGAGTGLLSIVAGKLMHATSTVVATDYHPDVLANLRKNVHANFPSSDSSVHVCTLDWESPQYDIAPLARPFDVILAADVIYHPDHARWIHDCVAQLLARPDRKSGKKGGVFSLVIPLRLAGRHEGLDSSIEAVFPDASAVDKHADARLAILEKERLERNGSGVGRADESGYRLFSVGWVE